MVQDRPGGVGWAGRRWCCPRLTGQRALPRLQRGESALGYDLYTPGGRAVNDLEDGIGRAMDAVKEAEKRPQSEDSREEDARFRLWRGLRSWR